MSCVLRLKHYSLCTMLTICRPIVTLLIPAEQQAQSNLFQFMKKTKKVRHKPEGEGIYLADLNLQDMDPEVAKLYFPQK